MDSQIIDKAKGIQTLLAEYGVDNDSLNTFIKEAETMPDSATLDKYNELVDAYNTAGGYEVKIECAKDLIAFYNAHPQELSVKQSEINNLVNVLEDVERLRRMYEELQSLIDDE